MCNRAVAVCADQKMKYDPGCPYLSLTDYQIPKQQFGALPDKILQLPEVITAIDHFILYGCDL